MTIIKELLKNENPLLEYFGIIFGRKISGLRTIIKRKPLTLWF